MFAFPLDLSRNADESGWSAVALPRMQVLPFSQAV